MSGKYFFGFSKSAPTPRYTILDTRLPLTMRSRKAGLLLATRARKVYSDTIIANGPHNTHLRFRYTCDDNRKQFAIIVAFAVYVPHWNVRYFICGSALIFCENTILRYELAMMAKFIEKCRRSRLFGE